MNINSERQDYGELRRRLWGKCHRLILEMIWGYLSSSGFSRIWNLQQSELLVGVNGTEPQGIFLAEMNWLYFVFLSKKSIFRFEDDLNLSVWCRNAAAFHGIHVSPTSQNKLPMFLRVFLKWSFSEGNATYYWWYSGKHSLLCFLVLFQTDTLYRGWMFHDKNV